MANGRSDRRKVVKIYSGEASAQEIAYRLLKICIDDGERGIEFRAAAKVRKDRDICKGKQG